MSDLKYSKRDVFKSIGRDAKLKEEILERISGQTSSTGLEARTRGLVGSNVDVANDILSGRDVGNPALEAIIEVVGRPVLRIQHDDLNDEDIPTETLQDQLAPNRDTIRQVVRSVGRIEVNGHRRLPWVGTGWVLADDVIVTNRHVAREFGIFTGTTFNFLPGVFGGPMTARVDFREEYGGGEPQEFALDEILFIEPEGGPDLAFLRVDWKDAGDQRHALPLWDDPIDTNRQVAVIGYPAKDTRTNIPTKMDEIFGDIYNVKRFAPGFVIAISDTNGLLTHDCTTLGGNSGSTVLDLGSGKAVALHFAGKEQEANFAVLAPVVGARLSEVRSGSAVTGFGVVPANEVVEEKPSIDEMAGRTGYEPYFLGVNVPLPGMSDVMRADAAPVAGRDDAVLHYTHYSVVMNRARRVAYYAVVNIDGNQLHGIPRGNDKWFFDPRIDAQYQVGNDLYKNNPLDRGHLVRRLDPSWGERRDIAELAVEDSFFYTNCAPQHMTLNRNWWLGLEDYILDNSDEFDLKATVFSGPVFRQDDEAYRGIQIPNEFWKVVVMVKAADAGDEVGQLSATGYVLSQRSLVDDLEFVFGDHQGFQVQLSLVEALTGLDFGNLKDADPLATATDEEAVVGGFAGAAKRAKRLRTYRDIVVSWPRL